MGKCAQVYPASCIIYTGPSIPHLGLYPGESTMEDVFLALLKDQADPENTLVDRVERLDSIIDALSSANILSGSSLFDVGSNKSLCGAALTELDFTYSIIPKKGTVKFSYNALGLEGVLPPGYKVISKSVRVISNGTSVISSGGLSGELEISHSRIPANILFSFLLSTPCGNIELRANTSILSTTIKGDYIGTLQVEDLSDSTKSALSQKDVNEILASELSMLKREVFSKKRATPEAQEQIQVIEYKTDLSSLEETVDKLNKELALMKEQQRRFATQ